MSFASVRFWIGILLLIDSGIALAGLGAWQRIMPGVNIRLLALVELAAAAIILALHFFFSAR